MNLKLDEMTISEKLQAMELLWDDITKNAPDFNSPEWHGYELKKREQRVKNGKESFVDWDKAKKEIW